METPDPAKTDPADPSLDDGFRVHTASGLEPVATGAILEDRELAGGDSDSGGRLLPGLGKHRRSSLGGGAGGIIESLDALERSQHVAWFAVKGIEAVRMMDDEHSREGGVLSQ